MPTQDEDHGDEVRSLRALFRERRLSIATMDRPLRLATGGAIASLIGVILLIALRDVHAPSVVLGRSAGFINEISEPVFIATLVLVSIGFAYMLTGAVLASWQIAVLSLLAITGVIGVEAGAFGNLVGFHGFVSVLPGWARWVTRGLLVGLWLVPAVNWLVEGRTGHKQHAHHKRLVILGIYTLIFGSYFAVLAIASPSTGALNLFPQVTDAMMLDLVLLVNPILQVASVDFGEWGGLLGERSAAALRGNRERWLTAMAVALSATLVILGYAKLPTTHPQLSITRLWTGARMVILLGIALVVILAVGRWLGVHRRRWPATLNFAAIFAVCAVGSYVIVPLVTQLVGDFHAKKTAVEEVTAEGEYTAAANVISAHGGTATDGFTLLIPRGWAPSSAKSVDRWSTYVVPAEGGTVVSGFEQVSVHLFPVQGGASAIATFAGSTPVGPQTRLGPWTRVPVAHAGGAELIWVRPLPNAHPGVYVMVDAIEGAPLATVQPLFDAVANSFRLPGQVAATLPAPAAEAPDPKAAAHSDRIKTIDLVIGGFVALALLLLVAARGRRWPPRLVGALLLFGMTTLATLLFFADSVGRTWLGVHVRWPYVGQYGLLLGVGMLALMALFATRGKSPQYRRQLTVGLIGLEATLWTLQGMSVLYSHALAASRISAWAAIIVLVAIAWDVTMSGDSMTNAGTKHVPRDTRVLAFFGYVILVAATVLFYSAQRVIATGHAAEGLFEPESITQAALFRIAFPLAVLLFLLRFGREPKRRSGGTPTSPPDGDDALSRFTGRSDGSRAAPGQSAAELAQPRRRRVTSAS